MRCTLWMALTPLMLAGCLTPFTSRLDEANANAAAINKQLVIATAKLDEATAILSRSEAKLDEANKTFCRLETRITEMDKKFTTIEQGFKKMFGIKGDGKLECWLDNPDYFESNSPQIGEQRQVTPIAHFVLPPAPANEPIGR